MPPRNEAATAQIADLRRQLSDAKRELGTRASNAEAAVENESLKRELEAARAALETAKLESVDGLSRAAACVHVVEDAVGSAVALHEFHGLDPAMKVRIELAAAREHLCDYEDARYCSRPEQIQADFSLDIDADRASTALQDALSERDAARRDLSLIHI